ncbi:flavin reductase family protein [Chloroflexota bacterium]
MGKVRMGPQAFIYPTPTLLVGANVDGKPNFLAVAWGGIANSTPPMVSVALQRHRYTNKGIKQNGVFSVNIPSVDLLRETDYCGIVSGAKVNKVEACKFTIFYGKLEGAPLIEQCPINLECEVVHTLGLGSHELIIGKIDETHVTEACLSDGKPDVTKVKPFIFTTGTRQYYGFGEVIAKAFSIGRELEEG